MPEDIYLTGQYAENNPGWHEEDAPWKSAQILKMLRKHGIVPGSLCDIGCGTGGVLEHLSEALPGCRMTGYERSPQALALAAARARENLAFSSDDPFEAPEVFDLAMAIDVFEHVEDYLGFLRSMRLKGDLKLYHIPLDMNVQAVLRATPILWARHTVGHLHYFSKETALESLRYTGHEVVDAFYTPGGIVSPGRSLKARISAVPRAILHRISDDVAVRLLGGYSLLALCR